MSNVCRHTYVYRPLHLDYWICRGCGYLLTVIVIGTVEDLPLMKKEEAITE